MKANQHIESGTMYTKKRLEALSDGVFAVAMTLLVLDLFVPVVSQSSPDAELFRELIGLWPKLLAYFLSFMIIGVAWVNHEFIFRFMRQINSRLVWLNITILIVLVLLPFSTSLAGEYWQSQVAILIWGANGLVTIALIIILWTYARRKGFLRTGISPQNVKIRKIVDIASIALLLGAFGFSFYSPIVAMFFYGVMIIFHVVATAFGFHEYRSEIE